MPPDDGAVRLEVQLLELVELTLLQPVGVEQLDDEVLDLPDERRERRVGSCAAAERKSSFSRVASSCARTRVASSMRARLSSVTAACSARSCTRAAKGPRWPATTAPGTGLRCGSSGQPRCRGVTALARSYARAASRRARRAWPRLSQGSRGGSSLGARGQVGAAIQKADHVRPPTMIAACSRSSRSGSATTSQSPSRAVCSRP